MEILTTEQQGRNFQSLSSYRPMTGKDDIASMVQAFRHGEKWFDSLFVHDLATDEMMGRLAELSRRSLILESPHACQAGRCFHFRLKLPSAVLGHSQILFEASCSNSHQHVEGSYLNTFTSLQADPADMDALEMLIMKFAIRTMD